MKSIIGRLPYPRAIDEPKTEAGGISGPETQLCLNA